MTVTEQNLHFSPILLTYRVSHTPNKERIALFLTVSRQNKR